MDFDDLEKRYGPEVEGISLEEIENGNKQEVFSSSKKSYRKSSNSISSASPLKPYQPRSGTKERSFRILELSSAKKESNKEREESPREFTYDYDASKEIVMKLIKEGEISDTTLDRLKPGVDINDLIINFYLDYL